MYSVGVSQENIQQKIEDGSYYSEARKWYNAIYISPISERIFFIILTCMAIVVFLVSVVAFIGLLPISPRIPFVYSAKDIIGEAPKIIRFKLPTEPTNPALIKYYLGTYVKMRESYSEDTFLMSRAFINNYSEAHLFDEYNRLTHPSNPRSPIRQYGKFADVKVTVDSISFDRSSQPYKGIVNYSTELIGKQSKQKTRWTATINFFYTDLVERDVIDEKTGEIRLEFDEPTFKVTSYQKRERLNTAAQ